jgi:hypothetical protein
VLFIVQGIDGIGADYLAKAQESPRLLSRQVIFSSSPPWGKISLNKNLEEGITHLFSTMIHQ